MRITGNVNMQKAASLLATAKKEPLPLLLDVGEVGGDIRVPLVGNEGLLVEHVQPTSTLVIPGPLLLPRLVPLHGGEQAGLVSPTKGLTQCKNL